MMGNIETVNPELAALRDPALIYIIVFRSVSGELSWNGKHFIHIQPNGPNDHNAHGFQDVDAIAEYYKALKYAHVHLDDGSLEFISMPKFISQRR